MKEIYFKIFLDEKFIGMTLLENADVPKGVLFGKILLYNIHNPYNYFKSYCLKKKIDFSDDINYKFISTRNIPNLKIYDIDLTEIKGLSTSISGQGIDNYKITIEGIHHDIFKSKFQFHIENYENLLEQFFQTDNINEIGIDENERLYIKPELATFPLIYRTATAVHWEEKRKYLYSPKPVEWTYIDWYNQIINVLNTECNYKFKITNTTKWTNISDDLKKQIMEIYKID